MAKYITHLDVSLCKDEEVDLTAQGYRKINVNLNEGAGGNAIYLWYKEGSVPITRVQCSFSDDMAVGLINAGYTKIDKNLSAGAGGSVINLWFFRGSSEYDVPIVEINVTSDVANAVVNFGAGWERQACDLNRKGIHLWLKREKKTYICDVTASDSYDSDTDHFKQGYIRVDENTNRGGGGVPAFIWYRQTTSFQRAVSDLSVSTNNTEYQALQQQNYTPVKVNLNEGTTGPLIYLWYKKDNFDEPIKAITLLLNKAAVKQYKEAGVTVIERNLNTGNSGSIEYVCYYQ